MSLQIIRNGPKQIEHHISLWRYILLPQLLLLLNGRLSLPSIRTLQRHDSLEGRGRWDEKVQTVAFTAEEYGQIVDYIKTRRLSHDARQLFESNALSGTYDQRLIFERWSEIILSTRYALCFFASSHESIVMWRQYAPDGVAIKTSARKLDDALSATAHEWRISRMIYKDLAMDITDDGAYNDPDIHEALRRPFLLKQKEYEGENEVRLFTVDPEARSHQNIESVSPKAWIEEVRISPDLWSGDAEQIRDLIELRYSEIKGLVHHSPVRKKPAFGEKNRQELIAEIERENAARHWREILRKP